MSEAAGAPVTLSPGFTDPVHAAQRCFRAVMTALAEPALPVPLVPDLAPPAPLTPTMAAAALTLLDYETPFWLDPGLAAAPAVAAFLCFHTGAPLVADAADAAFALVCDAQALPDFGSFAQGGADDPERSATLIVAVAGFADGPLTLAGPGIRGTRGFGADGLPADFAARLARNAAGYPLGVDVILCGPGAIAGLPRTTRPVTEG